MKLIITSADDVAPRLRKNALLLLGERVAATNANSNKKRGERENVLNVELIGELIDIVNNAENTDILIKHAGIVGVERLAKNIVLKSGEEGCFAPALKMCISILEGGEEELLSVCGLCVGELLARLKVRALPLLPKLMKCVLKDDAASTEWGLRVLLSVANTLGSFLNPYLEQLLNNDALFTPSKKTIAMEEEVDDDASSPPTSPRRSPTTAILLLSPTASPSTSMRSITPLVVTSPPL